ncbi:hypothetical protein J2R73_006848 [Bradyrhizobium japonicum]|nr:hypothetical protein [Bradyrhizobium japonicum]MCP1782416.1 hypothetical protein [Bradyrhizobium japonicum]MCP1861844.1 hypothetical protein [Bradyrhizobium japonicum]MCP1892600.1 hypothetical protein [Bradyrhizobium japonicum]MCP1965294.1 hypothetical protein [Bradyrhizobium japonicum]
MLEDRRRVDLSQTGLLGEPYPRFTATTKFSSMNAIPPGRAQLRSRRVNLDTGRENVVVISRRSTALRPDLFRGFSRVELRSGSKTQLATVLLTDDDSLVGPDELGMAEPAFRRFGQPAGSYIAVTPAPSPPSLDAVRAKIQGKTLEPPEIPVGRSKSPGYGHLKLPHLMIAVSAAEQQ